jgi:hypothetical protein
MIEGQNEQQGKRESGKESELKIGANGMNGKRGIRYFPSELLKKQKGQG